VNVYPELTVPSVPVISAAKIDADQAEILTATIPSSGASTYSYAWHISVNGGSYSGTTECAVNTGSGQIAGNTVTCSIPGNTLSAGNNYNFEIEVTDSSTASEGVFSDPSGTITVSLPLIAPAAPLALEPLLDVDETEAVTATLPSTGTSPFFYSWLFSDNGGLFGTAPCDVSSGSGQVSGNTVTCSIPGNALSIGHAYSFELEVSDGASIPETATSASSSSVSVSSQLTQASVPTASASEVNAYQAETITGVVPSTGTPLYFYHWHQSINGGSPFHSPLCTQTIGSNQLAGGSVEIL
jgi:hypothetical protein